MKIKELKEGQPLKTEDVIKIFTIPAFSGVEPTPQRETVVTSKFITDGELVMSSGNPEEKIEEYYIGRKKYDYPVNRLRKRNLYFQNYTYIIEYVVAREWKTIGHVHGWFDIVEDIKVYLENTKDKQALRTAKKVINERDRIARSTDYSSVLSSLLGPRMPESQRKYEFEKTSPNVYTLKKPKNI